MKSRTNIVLAICFACLIFPCLGLYFGLAYEISLRGRWFERTFLLIYILTLIYGLFYATRHQLRKKKQLFIVAGLIPVVGSIFLVLWSPIGFLNLSTMAIGNTLNNQKIFFENDEFKIIQAHSLSTNSAFEIHRKGFITETKEKQFQTSLNLKDCDIEYFENGFNIDNSTGEKLRIELMKKK